LRQRLEKHTGGRALEEITEEAGTEDEDEEEEEVEEDAGGAAAVYRTAPGPIWDARDTLEMRSLFPPTNESINASWGDPGGGGDGGGGPMGPRGRGGLGVGSRHQAAGATISVPPGSFTAAFTEPGLAAEPPLLLPAGLLSRTNEAEGGALGGGGGFQAAAKDLSGNPDASLPGLCLRGLSCSFYESFGGEEDSAGQGGRFSSLMLPLPRMPPPGSQGGGVRDSVESYGSQSSWGSGAGVIGDRIHSASLCPPIRSTVSFEFGKQLGSGSYGQVFLCSIFSNTHSS